MLDLAKNTAAKKSRNCPICDQVSSTSLPAISRDQWSVEQCDGCNHVYLKNLPRYDALIEEFAWEKTYETEHERHLLEHEDEPLKVLKGAARTLKPTGNIYVRVPNFGSLNRKVTGKKWVGLRYPDHVNYFTVTDLETIASKAGLKVKLLNPIRLPFDDNINALLSLAD